ncbi:discoidin, CUB and LCCL domain-containing protein 2-like [Lacerta agilis]|uniref:discoidin, CUB and LCCL domain-containing protein 2-like n=1 Tax=Lacerta agilis TaxID=80427 RepID=UPI001419F190|nr:discoidin, CUB and LCCL domain-containing protein 2-like [Lacerta agilis]
MRPALRALQLLQLLQHLDLASGQTGDGCGHSTLTPYSGTLTSKNYPGTYPNFTSCEWKIHGAAGSYLSLIFGDVDIEASEQCKSGFLLLSSPSDGTHFGKDNRLTSWCVTCSLSSSLSLSPGPYCSNSNPPRTVLVMDSASVTILFNTTTHRSGRGFLLSYASGNQSDLISCLQKGIHYEKEQIRVYCPAGCKGVTGDIWGNTNQGYRDTSVICKAAVHAGVILDEQGGQVTVSREKGITLYESTFANGLYSKRGSLSEKRLIFHKACSSFLEVSGFNASSYWHEQNVMGENKAWIAEQASFGADGTSWAALQSSADEWLEIDLGGKRNITGIITKGSSHKHDYYVKSYQVLSSRDGKNWKVYKSNGGHEEKVFEGNKNSHEEVSNAFIPPILARYLRIVPHSWNQRVALKVALLGCQVARLKSQHPYSDGGCKEGWGRLYVWFLERRFIYLWVLMGFVTFHTLYKAVTSQGRPSSSWWWRRRHRQGLEPEVDLCPLKLYPFAVRSGPKESPLLTSSPAVFTRIPGIVINSEKTGPPLLVMLLIGGFVLISSALLLLVFLCRKKSRKTPADQDCNLIKGFPTSEASQVCPRGSLQLSTSEIASFPRSGTPVDLSRAQSPEYAEPDVVQVSPSTQSIPSTFKPALDEGYTLPLVVNHYDVPGKHHEYAEPLPPEPEYATPFLDQSPPAEPEGGAFRKNVCVIKVISSPQSQAGPLVSPVCPEALAQYDSPAQRLAEKPEGKADEAGLQEGPAQTGTIYTEPHGNRTLSPRDERPPAQPATSPQSHCFQITDSPLTHVYHEPL